MDFPFKKKRTAYTIAEVLEDGIEITNQEMQQPKYRSYTGSEPMLELHVRVQPEARPPFETKMKAGLSQAFLLKPGVRVRVRYQPTEKPQVALEDENQAILARNPQLTKKD